MKLEVEMYVRFDDGTIAKIIDIKRYKTKDDIYYFDKELDWHEDRSCNNNIIYEHQFEYLGEIKAGFEPMNLIEAGDYVNGCKVHRIANCITIILDNEENISWVKPSDIKSIVTKECFKSMEYKVGE